MPSKISVPIGTPSSKALWHTEGIAVESQRTEVANVAFNEYEILKVFSIRAAGLVMTIEEGQRVV